jgi:dCTP deaminase
MVMTVLGASVLKDMVRKYKVIHPTVESAFDGDGYVLTVRKDRTLNYLEHRNMVSKEIVFTPPDCVAHLTSKSRFGRLGLSFLNSVKVHSGFVGRLALELVNLSNERTPITINEGDPLIHIEFLRREGDPAPYGGRYMFQYMDESETEMYVKVLSEGFPNLFTKKKLDEMRKNRLVSESEV